MATKSLAFWACRICAAMTITDDRDTPPTQMAPDPNPPHGAGHEWMYQFTAEVDIIKEAT